MRSLYTARASISLVRRANAPSIFCHVVIMCLLSSESVNKVNPPAEGPRRSVTVWENYCELLTIGRDYTCHYGGEDNKESRRSASFSSVTAGTEFGDNGFKRDFESRTIC